MEQDLGLDLWLDLWLYLVILGLYLEVILGIILAVRLAVRLWFFGASHGFWSRFFVQHPGGAGMGHWRKIGQNRNYRIESKKFDSAGIRDQN